MSAQSMSIEPTITPQEVKDMKEAFERRIEDLQNPKKSPNEAYHEFLSKQKHVLHMSHEEIFTAGFNAALNKG